MVLSGLRDVDKLGVQDQMCMWKAGTQQHRGKGKGRREAGSWE
jgi:hypothetical protein